MAVAGFVLVTAGTFQAARMRECCDEKGIELAGLKESQGRVLKIVLAINLVMFIVEMAAGALARSTALMADSLDMLGDAAVYGFSLYVLHKSARWRAGGAILKGVLMLAFGIGVLVEALLKIFLGGVPSVATMGGIGTLALAANGACLGLLYKHRRDDINMRSTWICSRNDIIANVGVLFAALGVFATGSALPDIGVGFAIAGLILVSAGRTLADAFPEFFGHERCQIR